MTHMRVVCTVKCLRLYLEVKCYETKRYVFQVIYLKVPCFVCQLVNNSPELI